MTTTINPDFSSVMGRAEPSAPVKVMLTVERDGPQVQVRINSSSLSLLQTCPRKSYYSLAQGWRSKTTSAPLIYGSAIHKAMEVFYSQPRGQREVPVNFDHFALLMAQGHEAPEQHFLYEAVTAFLSTGEGLKSLPDSDSRSQSSGVWVLGHYFNTYINDVYEICHDSAGPITERGFEFVLYEDSTIRIIIFGTIDLILRNTVTGEELPGDHKTTSRMGTEFFQRLKPNHQYTGYLMGARKCLNINTENFCVNGIESKARPKTERAGPPKFTRQITSRSEEDFAEFTSVIREAVGNYLRWQDSGNWPLGDVNACAMYGGCGYLDVCAAPNQLRQNILEAKFTKGMI